MNTHTRQHAIVIGGSIAGLLSARVLSDHFERVTVIERDRLPADADYRAGVPQARHLHTLLAKGQEILEGLFPGFNADMDATGAPRATWGLDNAFVTVGGWTQQFDAGIVTNTAGRVAIEWLVRRRVSQLPNVRFIQETEVRDLLADAGRQTVIGVRTESRADHSVHELYGDLVVDASGRSSPAPQWLESLGYAAPAETVINAHCGYASRWYQIPANAQLKLKAVAIQPRAPEGLYRGGGLLEVEGKRWVVTLLGANEDYPPTDEAGFLDYAKSLADPVIYEAIKDAMPISPIYGYRRLENRMRHYERLARRPENFIVIGDGACAFNPIYGQGMSGAAIEVVELANLLERYRGKNLRGFAARFQKRLAKVVQDAWLISTSEDMRYPLVEGQKPNLPTRLIHKYFDRVAHTMPADDTVTKTFMEVMCLLKPAAELMHPAIVVRVLRHTLFGHKPSRSPAPRLTTAEVQAMK